jgi:hypothetical protein
MSNNLNKKKKKRVLEIPESSSVPSNLPWLSFLSCGCILSMDDVYMFFLFERR